PKPATIGRGEQELVCRAVSHRVADIVDEAHRDRDTPPPIARLGRFDLHSSRDLDLGALDPKPTRCEVHITDLESSDLTPPQSAERGETDEGSVVQHSTGKLFNLADGQDMVST